MTLVAGRYELGGAVGVVAGGDGADVGVVAHVEGAFDLDAVEVAAVVGDEVVGAGLSPGLGDAEAEFGGGDHETEFGPFSASLGQADVHPFIFHWFTDLGLPTWNNAPPDECVRGYTSWDNKKRGLGGPRWLFCLYFYFIKLEGVKWTFFEIY